MGCGDHGDMACRCEEVSMTPCDDRGRERAECVVCSVCVVVPVCVSTLSTTSPVSVFHTAAASAVPPRRRVASGDHCSASTAPVRRAGRVWASTPRRYTRTTPSPHAVARQHPSGCTQHRGDRRGGEDKERGNEKRRRRRRRRRRNE